MRPRQTDPVSCLLVAACIVVDADPAEAKEYIGHDGMEIIWPHLKMPFCCRGYHPQEVIDYLIGKGYMATLIEVHPASWQGVGTVEQAIYIGEHARLRLQAYMEAFSGVLILESHAVAWLHEESVAVNTDGQILPPDVESALRSEIKSFLAIGKLAH